jgi:putative hydrolase of the HAD superfamily
MTKRTHARKENNPALNKFIMSIKTITFDLDNTLWDVEPVLVNAEQTVYQWLQQHTPLVTERFSIAELRRSRMKLYQQRPELTHQITQLRITSLEEALKVVGYDAHFASQQALQAFDVFIVARHQVVFYEQAIELLSNLSQHYTLGALTNGNADVYQLEISEFFDFSFSAQQLNASKPAADQFHAALDASGAQAHELVHIGDDIECDVKGALAVGCHAIWYNPKRAPWPGAEPAPLQAYSLRDTPALIEQL